MLGVLSVAGLSPVDLVFLASEVVVVALGLAIAYVAYQGYRRHDARPMLYVSVGFALALGVPAIAAGFYVAVPAISEAVTGAVTQTATILGLASILYGLRMNPG
jgi:hypothetical protein